METDKKSLQLLLGIIEYEKIKSDSQMSRNLYKIRGLLNRETGSIPLYFANNGSPTFFS